MAAAAVLRRQVQILQSNSWPFRKLEVEMTGAPYRLLLGGSLPVVSEKGRSNEQLLFVFVFHVEAASQQTFQSYGRSRYITACLESQQPICVVTRKRPIREFGEMKTVKNKLFPVHLCLHILLIQKLFLHLYPVFLHSFVRAAESRQPVSVIREICV